MLIFATVLALLLDIEATVSTSVSRGSITEISKPLITSTEANALLAPQDNAPPALTEAIANKSRIKARPVVLREPEYNRPISAIKAGEYGEVIISGILGEDGKIYEPFIKVSSRSDIIDRQAMGDVSFFEFSPARDADGHAIKIPISLSLEYSHVEFRGPNSLTQYRCDQAVKDFDWWNRTWPSNEKDRIYATLKGMVAVQSLQAGNRTALNFDEEWKTAIEACRRQPDKRFLDLLRSDGDLIKKMAKS